MVTMGDKMNQLLCYTVSGIIFVTIVGTLSHFSYGWSGNNPVVGLLSPVNESIWEHIKLLFFPMLLYSLFMSSQLKEIYPCIDSALLFGILLGSALIPIIFYTYTGILGYNLLVLDILTFIISVVTAFFAVYKLTLSCKAANEQMLLRTAVFIMAAAFFLFTYFPPEIGLFQELKD